MNAPKIEQNQQIVLASHNKGKLAEFSKMFAPYDITVVLASDLNLSEPDETEDTFSGNALIKARTAAKESGLIAMADDSGLCVEALDGAPGVYSADWAYRPDETETGQDVRDFDYAMQSVHDKMAGSDNKNAAFVAVIAIVWPDGREMTFEGRCEGNITWPPRGEKGFGYDPMFIPEGETETFAENPSFKSKFSHRHRAFEKMVLELF